MLKLVEAVSTRRVRVSSGGHEWWVCPLDELQVTDPWDQRLLAALRQ